jgi:rubrerythrin
MPSVKGTKTEKNLMTAFAGESQARNRYAFFASAARKEGFIQIANIFAETADQEKEHAKRFFGLLEGGEVEMAGAFPAGGVGTTAQNLKAAADGERHEWTAMYPDFARVAETEGLQGVAMVYRNILVAERQHEKRYRALLANVEQGKVFKKDKPVAWRCANCGYVYQGTDAPGACPACAHPRDYFEVLGENW